MKEATADEYLMGRAGVPAKDKKATEMVYANQVQIYTNPMDIEILFRRQQNARFNEDPAAESAPVVVDVVSVTMSPQHAKSMLRVLTGVVERYEETFGKLHEPGLRPDGVVVN